MINNHINISGTNTGQINTGDNVAQSQSSGEISSLLLEIQEELIKMGKDHVEFDEHLKNLSTLVNSNDKISVTSAINSIVKIAEGSSKILSSIAALSKAFGL